MYSFIEMLKKLPDWWWDKFLNDSNIFAASIMIGMIFSLMIFCALIGIFNVIKEHNKRKGKEIRGF